MKPFGSAACGFALVLAGGVAEARENLWIVSSTTDFTYTAAVSESFARNYRQPAPFIERFGPRTGIRLFCAGLGHYHPDVIGVPRRMEAAEFDNCKENGVTRITEIKVGYDAVVVARSGKGEAFDLSLEQLYQALAAEVPVKGEVVENPYRRWSDIDPDLPDVEIKVYGPAGQSDFGVLFLQDMIAAGCRKVRARAGLDQEESDYDCWSVRNDGAYVTVGRRLEEAQRQVLADPSALAVLPFSFLVRKAPGLAAVPIDGVAPSKVSIAMDRYVATCPIYLYVKAQHIERVPGILEFVTEYTSDWAWSPGGYLEDAGLVPLSHRDRIAERSNAIGLNPTWH